MLQMFNQGLFLLVCCSLNTNELTETVAEVSTASITSAADARKIARLEEQV